VQAAGKITCRTVVGQQKPVVLALRASPGDALLHDLDIVAPFRAVVVNLADGTFLGGRDHVGAVATGTAPIRRAPT
jgi:hypothetical protein